MSDHRNHEMHENSLQAYSAEEENLSGRKAKVLAVYRKVGIPLRDREVMRALGFVDPNSVRPIISRLIDEKILCEVGSETDPVTGRTVRLVTLNPTRAEAKN